MLHMCTATFGVNSSSEGYFRQLLQWFTAGNLVGFTPEFREVGFAVRRHREHIVFGTDIQSR